MKIEGKLKKRGWTKREIDNTLKLVREAKNNKHPAIKILDKSVYWIALMAAFVGNFIVSIVLIPFLLTLNNFQLYLVVITIGLTFGLLFELLIRSITHLEAKHHLFFGLLVPIIAIINVFIITIYSKNLEKKLMIESTYNPLAVSVVYGIAFIIPYVVYHLFLKE